MAAKKNIWLDCDPGHDDAMAIILASHNESVNLLGVSTVHGNQQIDKVTKNALRILLLCGRTDIDVVQGQCKPLLRDSKHCPEIHGDSGLDGPFWRLDTKEALPDKAINVMFESIRTTHSKIGEGDFVYLVCTGALTNAALLLSVYPEIKQYIQIVFMGGCMGIGNTGPVMEFNMQCDPEAAKIVLESGVQVTMVPLEVTHTALVTPAVLEAIDRNGGPELSEFRKTIMELLLFFSRSYQSVFGFEHPPLHDPCAVAFVIAPHLFLTQRLRVDVEVRSELSAGQTVCDVWGQSGKPTNVEVAKEMDVNAFWALMLDALDRAEVASCR